MASLGLEVFKEGQPIFATISAKDRRRPPEYALLATTYALALQHDPELDVAHQDAQVVSNEYDGHQNALVLALINVIEVSPVRAQIYLVTTNEAVETSINDHRRDWKENGWRNAQGERTKFIELFMAADALMVQKSIECEAIRVSEHEAEQSSIFAFLSELNTHLLDEAARRST